MSCGGAAGARADGRSVGIDRCSLLEVGTHRRRTHEVENAHRLF